MMFLVSYRVDLRCPEPKHDPRRQLISYGALSRGLVDELESTLVLLKYLLNILLRD